MNVVVLGLDDWAGLNDLVTYTCSSNTISTKPIENSIFLDLDLRSFALLISGV